MSRCQLGWVDAALNQYLTLSPEHQHLIDTRLAELLNHPDDVNCSCDQASDLWTKGDRACG